MRRKSKTKDFYFKKITTGFIITILAAFFIFAYNGTVLPGEMFLYETMPFYNYNEDNAVAGVFKLNPAATIEAADNGEDIWNQETIPVFEVVNDIEIADNHVDKIEEDMEFHEGDIIGVSGIVYQDEADGANRNFNTEILAPYSLDDLKNFDYLANKFYIIDSNTRLLPGDVDVDKILKEDFQVGKGSGPKVLVFHTHSTEGYADSDGSLYDGIVGVGEKLTKLLNETYGIETIHSTERFDLVDGSPSIKGAYDRMNPVIAKLLQENPSIEVVIDLHRDSLPEGYPKLVTNINGKPTAKVMFVNGLSRLYADGKVEAVNTLPNPNLRDNMAFSLRTQLEANTLYPGFTRKVYLKAYRYSLHFKPKSLLVEVGAANNTKEEALNAAEPLADIIATVLSGN